VDGSEEYAVVERLPTPEEFVSLREAAGMPARPARADRRDRRDGTAETATVGDLPGFLRVVSGTGSDER
jgi:hypothetical protein